MELAAHRAFKVRIFHQRDCSAGVAHRRRIRHLNLRQVLCQGIFRHIREFTLKKEFAILADVEPHGLFVAVNGQVNIGFKQPVDPCWFQSSDQQCDIRAERVQMS